MFRTTPISIIDHPADGQHFTLGRPGRPRFIVLHGTGGISSLDWLTTTSSPPVSAHRLISTDGTVYKLVADENTAWGCGPSHMGPYHPQSAQWNLNGWALQIELENEQKQGSVYSARQIAAAGHQVAEWLSLYGPMPVLEHQMIDEHKKDPVAFPRAVFWQHVMAWWV